MNKPRKIDLFIRSAIKNHTSFRCPKCRLKMTVKEKSLSCKNSHSFNISKKGYVNLLLSAHDSIYSKALFEARRKTTEAGVFDPMINVVADMINDNHLYGKISILDAGCGEGSISSKIYSHLNFKEVEFHGIDISKEGIALAGNCELPMLWSVGDLSVLPYQDHVFDVVLNILSPCNYSEFFRVMKKNALIIKVVPGTGYLREFRDILFAGSNKASYSNERVKSLFKNNVDGFNSQRIRYTFSPDEKQLQNLIDMTPLLVDRSPCAEEVEKLKKIQAISLDYEILTGRKA